MIQAANNSNDPTTIQDIATDEPQTVPAESPVEALATATPSERLTSLLGELRSGVGGRWPTRNRLRDAVKVILGDPEFAPMKNVELASLTGFSSTTIGRIRRELMPAVSTAPAVVAEVTAEQHHTDLIQRSMADVAPAASDANHSERGESETTESTLSAMLAEIARYERDQSHEGAMAYADAMSAARELAGALVWLRLVGQAG